MLRAQLPLTIVSPITGATLHQESNDDLCVLDDANECCDPFVVMYLEQNPVGPGPAECIYISVDDPDPEDEEF